MANGTSPGGYPELLALYDSSLTYYDFFAKMSLTLYFFQKLARLAKIW